MKLAGYLKSEGILLSDDPVAIDKASLDLANAAYNGLNDVFKSVDSFRFPIIKAQPT